MASWLHGPACPAAIPSPDEAELQALLAVAA
jgi:hypothetical protein